MGKTQKRAAKRAAKDEAAGIARPVPKPKPKIEKTARHFVAGKVSDSLAEKPQQALRDLHALRARKQTPLLGTLQRWVRRVDDCFLSGDTEKLQVLHALCYVQGQGQDLPTLDLPVKVTRHPPLVVGKRAQLPADACDVKAQSRVCHTTPAAERQPPNVHDLVIHAPDDDCFPAPAKAPAPERHPVPGVPGAFVVSDVFSPAECARLVRCGEDLGFQVDEPAGSVRDKDVLGRACVWMAPEGLMERVWQRLKPFLPETIRVGPGVRGCDGEVVDLTGINPRFRSYRYDAGFEYRPHLDGAWPCSGFGDGGEYRYDVDGAQVSRLTLVVYLNAVEKGGRTNFFLLGDEPGEVCVRGVDPAVGSVLLFPHGDSHTIMHEGQRVEQGVKYILRTEVLYAKPNLRARPGQGAEEEEDADAPWGGPMPDKQKEREQRKKQVQKKIGKTGKTKDGRTLKKSKGRKR